MIIFYYIFSQRKGKKMNKPKFSVEKAQKTVEISSKIEGYKIPRNKTASNKRSKIKAKY